MCEKMKKYKLLILPLLFVAIPLAVWGMSDFPERTFLKETLSLLTLLGMFLMFGQFFWIRGSKDVVMMHKYIGYMFATMLFFHPFFIIIPRYFEAGVDPLDAFWVMITSFHSFGIVLGLITWCLMFVLVIISMFRCQLKLKYKLWKLIHGIVSVGVIVLGTWHAVDLGRHTNHTFSLLMIASALSTALLWFNGYFFHALHRLGEEQ